MDAILIISILAGELVKFPFLGSQGLVLLDIAIIFLILLGFYSLKFKFKKLNFSFKLGAFFILIALLSLLFTPLHLSGNEYLVSFSYTLRFFLYILLSYLIYSGAFFGFKKNITGSLVISGVGLSTLGLLQFLLFPNLVPLQTFGWDPHYFRTVSTFLDPNFAGAFFVLTILLILNKKATKSTVIFFVITYIALLTTFSRSSYLMFLISGTAFSLLKKSKKIFITTIVLFTILMLGFYLYTRLIAQPRGINRDQSASFRIDTWQDGLTIFQKSPFLGVGFNAYKYAIRQYHLANEQFLDSRGSTTNDSSFLYVLATTGIMGFLIYILFLFSLIKDGLKNNKILVAAIIGLIPHSFFANSFFYPFILIWIFLKAIDTKL